MAELRAASEGRRQAEAIRWQHGLGHAPIRNLFGFLERKYPPVLAVRYPMPQGPAGALLDLGEGARCLLAVNSATGDLGRQRFVAAHLLGHFLFDADRSSLHLEADLPGGDSPAEVRADVFAANLLLPEVVVRERLASSSFDMADGAQLAALALEYGLCAPSLAWHLNRIGVVGEKDCRRIAALDVVALASRIGMGDQVRRERGARGARIWPERYVALAVTAYDRGFWSRQQLRDALEDEVLVEEVTGGSPERRDGDEAATPGPSGAVAR